MIKVDKALVGAAGEHLVLSRLLTRGLLASPAPRGVRKVDILVNSLSGPEAFLVQVKTTTMGVHQGWQMNAQHEEIRESNLFYCFVDLKPEHPTVHVVPSEVVADVLTLDHQSWLDNPGRDGQQHKSTNMRKLRPGCVGQEPDWLDEYLEAWQLLSWSR